MDTDQQVLNTQAAANLLGVHVETIRRLARKGKLPSFKIGKDWRFKRDALLQWMETHSNHRHAPCLLVIDNEANIRKLLRRLLEKQGYRVITAANGHEGLAYTRQESIQLVLLDLNMPEMNGPEVVRELKKHSPSLPVIIVTGYPDSHLMMEVNVQCPVMLVPKPIDKNVLLSAVNITLEGTLSDDERSNLPASSLYGV